MRADSPGLGVRMQGSVGCSIPVAFECVTAEHNGCQSLASSPLVRPWEAFLGKVMLQSISQDLTGVSKRFQRGFTEEEGNWNQHVDLGP